MEASFRHGRAEPCVGANGGLLEEMTADEIDNAGFIAAGVGRMRFSGRGPKLRDFWSTTGCI